MATSQEPKYLLVGAILRPHGVLGEVRIKIITHYPERLSRLKKVFLTTSPDSDKVTEYALEGVRMHQAYALLKLEGINDRDQADRLRQLVVMVAIGDAIPLDKGEHYLYQLVGLTVQTEAGEALGTLTEVLETGANDVYIVESPRYGEVLIPATTETILSTDVATKLMTVRLPEGLLPSV
jgi:16S rRNA processing protein RimM